MLGHPRIPALEDLQACRRCLAACLRSPATAAACLTGAIRPWKSVGEIEPEDATQPRSKAGRASYLQVRLSNVVTKVTRRMVHKPVDLDLHRGMAAQQATELRRLEREVAEDTAKLQVRQKELERFLVSARCNNWSEAAERMRYLLSLFSATSEAQDPRRQKLIVDLLADIERLIARSDDDQVGKTLPVDGE